MYVGSVTLVMSDSLQSYELQPGFSVHGILQAWIVEWVDVPSRGSSWPRNWTCISFGSFIADRFFTAEPPGKPPNATVLY